MLWVKAVKWRKEISEREVEEFIEDKLRLKVEIKETNVILMREDGSIVIAELNSWEQKRNTMKKKKELERGIIIDDVTRKEREIQQKLRDSKKRKRKRNQQCESRIQENQSGREMVEMERERRKIGARKNKSIKSINKRKRETEQFFGLEGRGGKGITNLLLEDGGNKKKCEESWEYMEKFDAVGLTETWVERKSERKLRTNYQISTNIGFIEGTGEG